MNLNMLLNLLNRDERLVNISFTKPGPHDVYMTFEAYDDLNERNIIEVTMPFNTRGDNFTLAAFIESFMRRLDEKRRELWGITDDE